MANIPEYNSQFRVPSPRVSGVGVPQTAGAGAMAASEALGRAALMVEREQDRQNVAALAGARATAAERLSGLREEFARDTEFATLPDRYRSRIEEIGREVGEGLDDGARETFATAYRNIALGERQWAGQRARELETQTVRAGLVAGAERYADMMATAPSPQAREALMVDGLAQIRDAVDAGFIDPVTGQAFARSFGANADTVTARQLILDDPRSAAVALRRDDSFRLLPPDTRITLTERADARVRSLDAELERQAAEADRRRQLEALIAYDQVADRAAELKTAAADGRRFDAGEEGDIVAQLGSFAGWDPTKRQATRLKREVEETIAARGAVDTFLATGGEARLPAGTAGEAARTQLENLRTAVAKDPLTVANDRGDVPLHPIDAADPSTMARRRADSWRVQRLFAPLFPNGDSPQQFFTGSERDALSRQVGDANPEQQMAIAAAIQKGFGPDAGRAIDELDGAPKSFAWAGRLFLSGRQRTARDLLDGERLLGEDPNAAGAEHLRMALERELGSAFNGMGRERAQAIRAARAIYLARAGGKVGEDDPVNEELLTDAVHAAVGGEKDRAGDWWGGVAEWNGARVIAPTTMPRSAFTAQLGAMDDRSLAARSVGLGAPMYPDGTPFAAADLDDAWLVAVGDGQYMVSLTDPATEGASWLRGAGPDGRFVLDLNIPAPERRPAPPAADARAQQQERQAEMRRQALEALPQIEGIFERMKALPADRDISDLLADLVKSIRVLPPLPEEEGAPPRTLFGAEGMRGNVRGGSQAASGAEAVFPKSAEISAEDLQSAPRKTLRPFNPGEAVDNGDGSYSTERTVSAALPDGLWINAPSLWMSSEGPVNFGMNEDAIVETALAYERRTGTKFPRFKTVEEAIKASKSRSARGGVYTGAAAAGSAPR